MKTGIHSSAVDKDILLNFPHPKRIFLATQNYSDKIVGMIKYGSYFLLNPPMTIATSSPTPAPIATKRGKLSAKRPTTTPMPAPTSTGMRLNFYWLRGRSTMQSVMGVFQLPSLTPMCLNSRLSGERVIPSPAWSLPLFTLVLSRMRQR